MPDIENGTVTQGYQGDRDTVEGDFPHRHDQGRPRRRTSRHRQLSRDESTYRPSRIKAPAAVARMAMRVPSGEKLRFSSGISPVKMSHMPNKSMPRCLVSFIEWFLSAK